MLGGPGGGVALVDHTDVATDQCIQGAVLQHAFKPEAGLQAFLPVDGLDLGGDGLTLDGKVDLIADHKAQLVGLPVLHGHVGGLALLRRCAPPATRDQLKILGIAGQVAEFVLITHGFAPGLRIIRQCLGDGLLVDAGQASAYQGEQFDLCAWVD